MIKEFLESLKDGNRLKDYVINYYIDDDYDDVDNLIVSMEDLQKYGCISGMIGTLIYYDDTNDFFENYKEEINELLSEVIDGTGLSTEELFGNKFDKTDPLILECSNRNLLAWFGFEEMSNSIYEKVYENFKNKDIEYSS